MSNKLNQQVLILNQSYEPIGTISARKAVILIYLEKVEIIEEKPRLRIHTISNSYPFPSIVRLVRFFKVIRNEVILSRKNVLRRDGGKCQYCGIASKSMTVDHVLPRRRGGRNIWENLVCACIKCNNKKGDRTPAEAAMPLRKKPRKPSSIYFIQQSIGYVDERWRPYLYLV